MAPIVGATDETINETIVLIDVASDFAYISAWLAPENAPQANLLGNGHCQFENTCSYIRNKLSCYLLEDRFSKAVIIFHWVVFCHYRRVCTLAMMMPTFRMTLIQNISIHSVYV
ncbi:hypothetical protein [Tumebacillus algifaecis]|uniref:hypothetical protein n=1 Tax=Tumebacillus algifaecis TaxID=1214604 RepID=UPI0012FE649D|nr:hypothetical protein [Tumebacillus algifaecis]